MSKKCPSCGGEWEICECSAEHRSIGKLVNVLKKTAIDKGWEIPDVANATVNLFLEICLKYEKPVEEVKSIMERFLQIYAENLQRVKERSYR